MTTFRQYQGRDAGHQPPHSAKIPKARILGWWLLVVGPVLVAACGCGANSGRSSPASGPLAGNWQFTLIAPSDNSFSGAPANTQTTCGTSTTTPCPVQLGGFLLQNNQSVSGSVTYSIAASTQAPGVAPCSGSAPVTGTVNGQTVTLTVQASPQSFNLTGNLSADGKTMMGQYSSTDTRLCGNAQSGLQWSAVLVPPLSGAVQGFFHSVASHISFNPSFASDQDFPVSGVLTQGANVGSTHATLTGTLSFKGGYPCMGSVASVNGQISGSSIVLEVIGGNGLDVGQIGESTPAAQFQPGPVALETTAQGTILIGQNGYALTSKKCPGNPGDSGNICLALGDATACTQPVLMTPASLSFPPQLLGSTTFQKIILTNNTLGPLTGLSLTFNSQSGIPGSFGTVSDFSGLPNFTERDNCAPSLGAPFALGVGKSCAVFISFSPQQSCPWLPYAPAGDPSSSAAGAPPTVCPLASTGKLDVTMSSTSSSDGDASFALPVTGTGVSAIVPFPAELDFGAEVPPEKSQPQRITFTNQGFTPVQILPTAGTTCGAPGQLITLPRPITPGAISGLQVVENGNPNFISPLQNPATVQYACDLDPASALANFQISKDSCSGTTLNPKHSCSIQVSFVPQPATSLAAGLDFALELNTLQCTSGISTGCEIDSGRFPVELKASLPSPLRMSPGAGLDFPIQSVGQTSAPLTVTLFNDPKDPNRGIVNFTGNRVQGDYFESDNCGTSLAPGNSCTLNITFSPQGTGYDPGNIAIGYTIGNTLQLPQTIYLRGTGQ